MNKTVKPYLKSSYNDYVIRTAIHAGIAGAIIGGSAAVILLLLLIYWEPGEILFRTPFFAAGAIFGVSGLIGGLSYSRTITRESEKWDLHNLIEEEKSSTRSATAVVTAPNGSAASGLITVGLWVKRGNGETAVANWKLANKEIINLKSWLLSIAVGNESNVTRDHAINHWGIPVQVYKDWRITADNNKWVLKQGGNQNSPVYITNHGKEGCLFAATKIQLKEQV